MTHLLIKHKVKDYASWKDVFDNFMDFRKSSGEKSFQILHSDQSPNDLTLIFKWDNTNNAKTFLSSDELKSAMQNAGVAEEPEIVFLNEVAQGGNL